MRNRIVLMCAGSLALAGWCGLSGCDGGTSAADASVRADAPPSGDAPASAEDAGAEDAGAEDASIASDAPAASDAPVGAEIEIAGRYNDGFADHEISSTRWVLSGTDFVAGHAITRFDNAEDWAVAQNDATNAFNPGMWSRFEWMTVGADLYYCQAAFEALDEAAALAAARPDRSSPTTSGCGGFAWSLLTPSSTP